MDKRITVLDGSPEERDEVMKEFFGLSPEQTFQDIQFDDENEECME